MSYIMNDTQDLSCPGDELGIACDMQTNYLRESRYDIFRGCLDVMLCGLIKKINERQYKDCQLRDFFFFSDPCIYQYQRTGFISTITVCGEYQNLHGWNTIIGHGPYHEVFPA